MTRTARWVRYEGPLGKVVLMETGRRVVSRVEGQEDW
jgi:hypothetical protein